MILGLVDEAVAAGARQHLACKLLGVDAKTLQRWRAHDIGEDRRAGPVTPPKNKLSAAERQAVLELVNAPENRNLSVNQIVPALADRGRYLASESTIYRVLRAAGQTTHRAQSRPRQARAKPREAVATAPNQVWSWDITYLPGPVRGEFFYLYLFVDVFSRKIIGSAVHDHESATLAAELVRELCLAEGVTRQPLVLHADNGAPMKGATMLATLQQLGIDPSFSRPSVSNDNPFSEALFRTLKYRPSFPSRPFADLAAAQQWIDRFVHWYNTQHLHSAIRFVTPNARHFGLDTAQFAKRRAVYEAARAEHPERWSRETRNWSPILVVNLNPERDSAQPKHLKNAA